MDLRNNFQVGHWEIVPLEGRAVGPDGARKIRPKSTEVLVYLAQRAGQLVTRDELFRHVWGERVVTDDVLTTCIAELRRELGDDREHPEYIQTVPKRGYRLIANVSFATQKGEEESVTHITPHGREELEIPDKPSIAVLPFQNMSRNKEQDYFSDGIAEDIITELTRFTTLLVIARHSSFSFKGQNVNLQDIRRSLGVRYIVDGSVRRSRDTVRVTARLIDTDCESQIWSERYDRAITDIFEVQDEVVMSIVSTLPGQVEKDIAGLTSRVTTDNMTAYDCLLRGNWLRGHITRETLLEAQQLYQRAVDLDPDFAAAHSRLAATSISLEVGWAIRSDWQRTQQSVQRALALDPGDGYARLCLGYTLLRDGKWDEAREQIDMVVNRYPNDADCMVLASLCLIWLGDPEHAFELVTQAMRLNPLHHDSYYQFLGLACFYSGRNAEAVQAFRRTGSEHGLGHYATLAAAYGHLGMVEAAKPWLDRFLRETRQSLTAANQRIPARDFDLIEERTKRYRRQQDRDLFVDGLRKAGFG